MVAHTKLLLYVCILLAGLEALKTTPLSRRNTKNIKDGDLISKLVGAYKYIPEKSGKCPSVLSLVISKNKDFVKSYCFDGSTLWTFGKLESVKDDVVLEIPTPEDSKGQRLCKVELMENGFKYNSDSTMSSNNTKDLPEIKMMSLFGDFEFDSKKCKKYKYYSFYSNGNYVLTKCPKGKGSKTALEKGVFSLQDLKGDKLSLGIHRINGSPVRVPVQYLDQDHFVYKKEKMKRRKSYSN